MKKFLLILSIALLGTACKKELDSPPENVLNPTKQITVDSLRNLQKSVSPGGYSITDSLYVYGIVTMDESEGNIYKNLYLQDHTAGIQVRLTSSSDYAVGDSLRISLLGAYLSEYAGVIQLDSIDPDVMIVKQSENNSMAPTIMTVEELIQKSLIPEEFSQIEGSLIQLDNVQFSASELTGTYADAINQASQNRMLEDCNGNQVIVRTSGFAKYANQTVKQGNGSMVAIVGRFNSDLQLTIRSLPELKLDNERCAGQLFVKDFEDNSLTSGGWVNFVTVGSTQWIVDVFSSNYFGKVTNWNGSSNELCESWYISPALDFTNSTNASISFLNDVNYGGPALQLLVSTDYTGVGNPAITGTWIDISTSVSWDPNTSSWGFHDSGNIDLSAYVGNTVFVAFKYTGTASSGSTWEIDDIKVIG